MKNEELKVKSEFLSPFEGGQRGMIEMSITSPNPSSKREARISI
jgi:hypothetical protein